MGCFNATCAISGGAIFYKERVPLLFATSVPDEGSHPDIFYGNYYENVSHAHVTGVYNDYGAFEDVEGYAADAMLEHIKERLVEMEQGENPYHDFPVKRDELTWDKLMEANHAHRLYVTGAWSKGQRRRLSLLPVRPEVWKVIQKRQHLAYWSEDHGQSPATVEACLREMESLCQDMFGAGPDAKLFLRSRLMAFSKTRIFEALFRTGSSRSQAVGDAHLCLPTMVKELDELRPWIEHFMEGARVHWWMSKTQTNWTVPRQVGQDDTEETLNEKIAILTSARNAIKKHWE